MGAKDKLQTQINTHGLAPQPKEQKERRKDERKDEELNDRLCMKRSAEPDYASA